MGGVSSFVVENASAELLAAVTCASAELALRPADLQATFAACDFLMIDPSPFRLYTLLRPVLNAFVPTRQKLDVARGSLPCETLDERTLLDGEPLEGTRGIDDAVRGRLALGGYEGGGFAVGGVLSMAWRRRPRGGASARVRDRCTALPLETIVSLGRKETAEEYLSVFVACITDALTRAQNSDPGGLMQKRMREGLQRLSACGENDDDIPTDPCAHLFAPVEKELMRSCVRDAMLTMPDKVGGALYVAQNLGALWRCHGVGQHLLSWLCWRSFRMLGAMENEAETVEEIPHIRIEGICEAQDLFSSGALARDAFLPFSREQPLRVRVLPWATASTRPARRYTRSNVEQVLEELFRRVRWLEKVWSERTIEFSVTGSLLAEAVSPIPGVPLQAGDVDLFAKDATTTERLLEAVTRSMEQSYGSSLERVHVEVKGPGRYRATVTLKEASQAEAEGDASCSLNCDVYVNNFAAVARYHLPLVRMSLSNCDGGVLRIAPSCAIAHVTRICIDYHYFASKLKSPYEIITKKWRSGYNFCVTAREQRQLLCYARATYPDMFRSPPLSAVKADDDLSRYFLFLPHYRETNALYARRGLP
jgi:hypothetical protein